MVNSAFSFFLPQYFLSSEKKTNTNIFKQTELCNLSSAKAFNLGDEFSLPGKDSTKRSCVITTPK